MSWRIARCIRTLLDEVNAEFPGRSRVSDGTIGDAAHASRSSDHNPWVRDGNGGVVTAVDITHDPGAGLDAGQLAEYLRGLAVAGDPRVKYVISNGRIANPAIQRGAWRRYTGPNAHRHHVHLSVSSEKKHYDSTDGWGIAEEFAMPSAKEIAEAVRVVVREEAEAAVRKILTKEKLVPNRQQPWEGKALEPFTIVGALSNIEKDTDPRPASATPAAPAGQ